MRSGGVASSGNGAENVISPLSMKKIPSLAKQTKKAKEDDDREARRKTENAKVKQEKEKESSANQSK